MPLLMFQYAESTSEQPTKDLDTVLTEPVITPGGLDPDNNITTLGRMSQGSLTAKLVVAIEGCKYLLSDAPQAAVLAAWSGHDATEVLSGLFVELSNSQSISPDDPFPVGGRCVLRVLDTSADHSDVFGIYLNKRSTGDKTSLTATADRNDTTLAVARATDFAASGTAYLGTEAIGYTGTSSTSFTGVTRGKYAAFGCDSTGSGGARFARHHRVSTDPNTTLSNPVLSEVPRSWIGKGVSVYLHTWSEEDQQLNTKAQAQLIYVGRIAGIADDPDSMATVIDVEHLAADLKNTVIGKDLWAGEVAPGIHLRTGRKFTYTDTDDTSSPFSAVTTLTVVSSGASTAYQVNEGYYDGTELCSVLSRWLAAAKQAGTIDGFITVCYGVTSNVGLRTKIYSRFAPAGSSSCTYRLGMPGEVALFLGFSDGEDNDLGQTITIAPKGANIGSSLTIRQSENAPYSSLVFRPLGPGRAGASYIDYGIAYEVENERGQLWDNRPYLPASLKEACPDTQEWGLFLLDEKVLCVASVDIDTVPAYSVTLRNVWLAPFQLTSDNTSDAAPFIGRRLDEPQSPMTIRQVPIIEGQFKHLINWFAYSTGTAGYNHGTYDVLPHGLGAAIPGSLLGPEWERSLANLPGADSPICALIDEPTKFADLFRADFQLRRAFIRWHDQGFEFATWKTPLVALAEHALTESNKAGPAGQDENHRIASQESDQWHWPTVKVDYARDFAGSRNATYLKSIQLEDQSGTDGSGGAGRTLTLKMRNTFAQTANAGAAVEELIKEYLAGLPMFSRPSRMVVRSLDLRFFETVAVGDICTISDSFMRDPLSGLRGTASRAAIVTRITYDLGGPRPDGGVRDMVGEVELFFLDTQRGGIYSPGAEVHELINYGGFSAGYNATTSQLWLKRQAYAFGFTINTRRGPVTYTVERDAAAFAAGDKIVICERDPSNTASPTYWSREISAVAGDVITLTTSLSSPSWSASKQYRVFPQAYTSCAARQQDFVFQADSADEMIQDVEIADQYSATSVEVTFPASTHPTDKAELVADLTWGDGKPLDVGTDAALAKTANALMDYQTKHQQPFLTSETAPISVLAGGVDFDEASWVLFAGLYQFGIDHLSSTVTRTLTVAPMFRMTTLGAVGKIRVRLCRISPQTNPSAGEGGAPTGGDFGDPMLSAESSTTGVWETTSGTYSVGEDKTLSIAVKDLHWGMCWLIVEGAREVQCLGLAKIVEGPRSTG